MLRITLTTLFLAFATATGCNAKEMEVCKNWSDALDRVALMVTDDTENSDTPSGKAFEEGTCWNEDVAGNPKIMVTYTVSALPSTGEHLTVYLKSLGSGDKQRYAIEGVRN